MNLLSTRIEEAYPVLAGSGEQVIVRLITRTKVVASVGIE